MRAAHTSSPGSSRNPLLNVSALGTDQSVQTPQGYALDNKGVKLHGEPYALGQAERLLFLMAGLGKRAPSMPHPRIWDTPGWWMAHAGATLRQEAVGSPRKEKWGHLTTLNPSVSLEGTMGQQRR